MNVATLVGTSGPLALLAAFAGFFLKAYLEKRKGDREDRKTDRESESGIVETTKETLRIVRDQMGQIYEETKILRSQIADLEGRLHAKNAEAQLLRSQIADLEARLRAKDEDARLQSRRRNMPGQRTSSPEAGKDRPAS
jgi:septal ring factor EnvC (AmiA/AmiB activator)